MQRAAAAITVASAAQLKAGSNMLKWMGIVIAGCFALIGVAWAQVDANRADTVTLESVRGIGPATAQRIVQEREAHGPYQDWADFERRVKGIGLKRASSLSDSGLTIEGRPLPNAAGTPPKHGTASASSTLPPATTGGNGRRDKPKAGTTANPFKDRESGQ